ncbi:hypothetical protein CXB51_035084 [Gossypium anomalum]|uniref:Beta-glucosidase n=1 Tax=Gossypium anomalum TaxID=47600 RepID=A0A8J5XNU4_9ROSI|nr:hypothetical protein CXB51_035084 [Gossypium anomalum]
MHTRKGIALAITIVVVGIQAGLSEINRASFPKGFVFGTASAAFQYEGAVKEDGRGPTIWDTFSGIIIDGSNADVAVDQYHRYVEDIQLMKDMGMDAYRFSIAWSRIFPNGTGEINQAGVDHYNNLINALLAKGIEPYVTLYHWDLPQALEDKYIGWLDRRIIKDFALYAETCFGKFGDRVKNWIIFNEPHTFTVQGYYSGYEAPGRCSSLLCKVGNSTTEPYIVAHNVLLSYATVADSYRRNYKEKQNGSIGISLDVKWYEPVTNATENIEATQRAQDFQLGWFLDPLIFGDYPSSMRSRVGNRLPTFTESESALLKGSLDFVGINHYTTYYASENAANSIFDLLNDCVSDANAFAIPNYKSEDIISHLTEDAALFLMHAAFKDGKPIGDKANSIWLYIVPYGMRGVMKYIKETYGNPLVIITENGMDDPNNLLTPIKDALKDEKRIKYHTDYLTNLLAAIEEDGCNVKGYFVWSLLDNWEWVAGFTSRFGLYFVDYNDNLKRYPKNSVKWFKNFLSFARS